MKKVSILYIDDERINLLAFEALFRRNYTVHCAASAEEGFTCLTHNTIDYIFCDQQMPEMCGTEFFRKVKSKFPEIHCCILSGYIQDQSIKAVEQEGIIDKAFEKPFNPGILEKYINKTCKNEAEYLRK